MCKVNNDVQCVITVLQLSSRYKCTEIEHDVRASIVTIWLKISDSIESM